MSDRPYDDCWIAMYDRVGTQFLRCARLTGHDDRPAPTMVCTKLASLALKMPSPLASPVSSGATEACARLRREAVCSSASAGTPNKWRRPEMSVPPSSDTSAVPATTWVPASPRLITLPAAAAVSACTYPVI